MAVILLQLHRAPLILFQPERLLNGVLLQAGFTNWIFQVSPNLDPTFRTICVHFIIPTFFMRYIALLDVSRGISLLFLPIFFRDVICNISC